jgi:hypothetical protein
LRTSSCTCGIVTYQSGLPFSITDSTSGGTFGQREVAPAAGAPVRQKSPLLFKISDAPGPNDLN